MALLPFADAQAAHQVRKRVLADRLGTKRKISVEVYAQPATP
jgi:hypothetical protein